MISVLFCSNLFAQTRQQLLERQREASSASWDFKNIKPSFSIDQTFFTNSWTKGGDDSFSFRFIIENDFIRTDKWSELDNIIDIKYGRSRIGKGKESKVISNELYVRSDLVYKKRKYLNPFIGGTIKTPISNGYKYYEDKPKKPISEFWDPVKLTYRYGIDIALGVKGLKIRFSADHTEEIAETEIYAEEAKIDDRKTKDIVEKRKSTKKMSSYIKYNGSFMDNFITLRSEFNIKSAFKHYSLTEIDWKNTLTFRLYKFVSFRLFTNFIYNKIKTTRGQLKQISGITLTYNFSEMLKNDNNEEPEETFRTGVKVYDIDKIWARQFGLSSTDGALIVEVQEDSPGEKADLKKGDVITEVNGKRVKRVNDVLKCFDKANPQPGKEIDITVLRNGRSHKAILIVEEPQKKKEK